MPSLKKVRFSRFKLIFEYILNEEEINMKQKHFRYICECKKKRKQVNKFGRFYVE